MRGIGEFDNYEIEEFGMTARAISAVPKVSLVLAMARENFC
jgi:hypothetical protein